MEPKYTIKITQNDFTIITYIASTTTTEKANIFEYKRGTTVVKTEDFDKLEGVPEWDFLEPVMVTIFHPYNGSKVLCQGIFDSLQNKLKTLPDDTIVYPGHGAGSSCGKNLGPESHSTIGKEKQYNYAMKAETKDEFIAAVTTDLAEAPKYFSINAKINQTGYMPIEEVKQNALKPLSIDEVKALTAEGAILLDTRTNDVFVNGFIPGSIFIGLDGRFAEWAGTILPFDQPIILIAEAGKEDECVTRLARVGLDKIVGYVDGGFDAWKNAGENTDMIITIEADELAMDIPFDDKLLIVDVRKENEFEEGHIVDALNLPLSDLTDIASIASLEEEQNLYVHCAGGYRSVIACSLLKRQGLHNIRNIAGGWEKIKQEEKIKTEKSEKKPAVDKDQLN